MRNTNRQVAPTVLAGFSAVLLMRSAGAMPTYNIYPIPYGTGSYAPYGQAISQNGTYLAALTQTSGSYTYGLLYNTSNGASTVETQSGIYEPGSRSVLETTGVPAAVNNNGIMFGSSGAGSIIETGAPTVWQNGAASRFPNLGSIAGGQIYAANNLNVAVGSVKGTSAGEDEAAAFIYSSSNPSSSYLSYLTAPVGADSDTMNDAFGINDNLVIVGTATDNVPGNAALTVPFIYTYGAASGSVIPNSSSKFNSGIPFAISNTGLVTGSELYNSGGGEPFIYNISSGVTTSIAPPPNTGGGGGRGINDQGEIVGTGSGQYAVPFLYDGTNTYDLSELTVNNTSGAWNISDNTSSGAYEIADNGDIVGRALYNGVLTAFLMIPTGSSISAPQSLTFGGGTTWDTTSSNWNNGSGMTTFSSIDADNVTFNDNNGGSYNISISTKVTPGSVIFNNTGNYTINGPGSIGGNGQGTGSFTKYGTGSLTLNTVNTWYGPTNIYGGVVTLAVKGAIPSTTNLTISGSTNVSTQVIVPTMGAPYALTLGGLDAYGNGSIDIQNNAIIIHGGYISSTNAQLKAGYAGGLWNGYTDSADSYPPGTDYSGIVSSLAGPSYPLMAIGDIVNDNGSGTPFYGAGGSIALTFAGSTPVDGDILVKYTYYGDANLDGKVDGSDYSRIDVAFAADKTYFTNNPSGTTPPYTGWYNGDFNYDGLVNGSDYTLIDNAFNSQGAVITTQLAGATAQLAGTASPVPEPAMLSLVGVGALSLLGRRRRGTEN